MLLEESKQLFSAFFTPKYAKKWHIFENFFHILQNMHCKITKTETKHSLKSKKEFSSLSVSKSMPKNKKTNNKFALIPLRSCSAIASVMQGR